MDVVSLSQCEVRALEISTWWLELNSWINIGSQNNHTTTSKISEVGTGHGALMLIRSDELEPHNVLREKHESSTNSIVSRTSQFVAL